MSATRVLTGLRLSELARCPKATALRGLGAEPSEPSDRANRWLTRGRMFGQYAAIQFEQKHGKQNVEREREITWPLGTGHADVYVRSEKLIVEVVSSVSPAGILDAKMKQARQYLHFDEEAERAAVYVINPSDLDREDLIPVHLTDEHRNMIDAEVAAVQAALDGGPLPDCVAATPTACRWGCFCQFTDAAWAGWEKPLPTVRDDSPELVAAVRAFYEAKRVERKTKEMEAARKEAQEALTAFDLAPGCEYLIGGIKIKRTVVAGRETFSLSTAKKAGEWTPADDERFAPFVKIGQPSERWAVDADGELTDSFDYGEGNPF